MARVVWTGPAQRHVRDIHDFIAQDSRPAAATMVRRLRASVAQLRQFPGSGRTTPEYGDPSVREVIMRPYRVIYRTSPDSSLVEILAVVHGSRLLPSLRELDNLF